jgi:predicted nucleic acid-binding protein
VRRFVDTNVIVYANDPADLEKQRLARETLLEHADEIVISAQVLSELYSVLVRPSGLGMDASDARAIVEELRAYPVVPIDGELVTDAIELSIVSQLSYWDALILAAASASGCEILLSEDLSRGAVIGGVRIENPFATPE